MEHQAKAPDKNLFMVCERLKKEALAPLPRGYWVRTCEEGELDIWKAMPFDRPELAAEYRGFMAAYFDTVYGERRAEFFRRCLFVCDEGGRPVGTCFLWRAYRRITTLHWFKVLKDYEGRGIGRGLLSLVLEGAAPEDYPLYLHTQPSSYRAIKLYADFGFRLISDPRIGGRKNDLEDSLPLLQASMPARFYDRLQITRAPRELLEAADSSRVNEF